MYKRQVPNLPLKYSGTDVGRASQGAALALKCRILLRNEKWADAAKMCIRDSAWGDSEPVGQDDGCIRDTACSYRVWQCVPTGEAEGFFRGLKLFPGVILQPERPPAKGLREG